VELTNDFEVSVPVEQAWAVLTDLERIAPCLPGAQLTEIEGDEHRGTVKVKVGAITATYKGVATITERDDDAHRAVLVAKGRESRGSGNASATITAQLSPADLGTRVSLRTDLALTGKVASIGRGVLADVSGKLLAQFVENLETEVLAASSPEAAPAPASSAAGAAPKAPAAPAPPAPPSVRSASSGAPSASGASGSTASTAAEPAAGASGATTDSPTEPPAGAPAAVNGSGGVRRIDGPEAQPIDMLDMAGGSAARLLAPVAGSAAFGALLLLLWRRWRAKR
jgi:uncharacterized protein